MRANYEEMMIYFTCMNYIEFSLNILNLLAGDQPVPGQVERRDEQLPAEDRHPGEQNHWEGDGKKLPGVREFVSKKNSYKNWLHK